MFSILIQFLIPIVFILGLVLFVSASLNLSFERALPIGVLGSVLMTFFFGFVDLRIGLCVSIFFAFASIPIAVIRIRQKKYAISTQFFNTYFFAFLVIYFFLFVLNAGKCFDRWDEYSHWGMMTKEMYRLNKYYYVKESVLTAHREYPPFTQIWQYIWCKILGVFKESSLYNAKITLCLSVLLSAVARIIEPSYLNSTHNDRNSFIKLLQSIPIGLLVISLAAFPSLADGSMYRTIYAEGTMVVLTVYTIICVLFPYDDQVSDLLSYSVAMASLVLVKQIGVLFASISLLILVVRYIQICFVQNIRKPDDSIEYKKTNKNILTMLFTGVISAFIPWIIWNRVSKRYTTAGQFDSSRFSIIGIMDVIKGKGTTAQYQCINDYSHALFTWKLTWIPRTSYIVLTLIIWMILLFVLLYIKRRMNKFKSTSDVDSVRERIIDLESLLALIIVLPFTVVGYAVIMQVLYLFGFSEEEMRVLACFTRYMNSMLGIWWLVISIVLLNIAFSALAERLKKKERSNAFHRIFKHKNNLIIVVCMITIIVYLFLIGVSGLQYEFVPGILTTGSEGLFASDAEKIREYTHEGSRIYFVDTMGNDSATNIVRFLADGRFISDSFVAPKESNYDRVVQYMREFEYIYLDNIDEEFVSTYGGLFTDGPALSRQQMYKIDLYGENMILSYVDMSE